MQDLKDTVDNMLSADYKKRFFAEYDQLKIRRKKLSDMIEKYMSGELDFEPKTPIAILMAQCAIMDAYLAILKERSRVEELYDINE